jgi:hypothetical protein
MNNKRSTYQDRAEQLARAVDIADAIIKASTVFSEEYKTHFLKWGQQVKYMALNPEPQFKKIVSLKYLENDFLTFWNESNGQDIDKFWSTISANNIDYQRKDTIQAVLKRKKIKDIHEYDNIVDNIVVAEQLDQITKAQVVELNKLIGEFEERQAKKKK